MVAISGTLQKQIVYVVLIVISLYLMKPTVIFKPNGKPRVYGFGYDDEGYKRTLYTFQFVILILVLLLSNVM